MAQARKKAANEATKAAIMVVREAENTINNPRPVHTATTSSNLALKQSTFDWTVADKYQRTEHI